MVSDAEPWTTSAEYVAKRGAACPRCGSKDIESGPLSADGDRATADVECHTCGRSWVDDYALTGYRRHAPAAGGDDE